MLMTRRAFAGGLLAAPTLMGRAFAAEPVTYLFPAPAILPAFVPHQLAQKRGYFAAEGLAVTFQTGRGGAVPPNRSPSAMPTSAVASARRP